MGNVSQRNLSEVPRDDTPPRAPRAPRAERAPGDATPRGSARTKEALPTRRRTSTKRSYVPIALLLSAALVMAFMLWRGLQNTSSDSLPTIIDNVEVTAVNLVGVKSYDPDGDDKVENEDMLPALLDNNPASEWTTVCYGNQFFGSKAGVGVVATLSGVGIGDLVANFANGPYSADVFVSTAETVPSSVDAWGLRVGTAYSKDPGAATFEVNAPARHVLLLLREVGRSNSCSNANPFKGRISDLSFTSAK
jgi:hypothetical protein